VMWLNEHGLDIRCVRMLPYQDNGRVLVDVQQVIPLPEAAAYQVQVREKSRKERLARETSKDLTKYDVTISGVTEQRLAKRNAILRLVRYLCGGGVTPEQIAQVLSWYPKALFH